MFQLRSGKSPTARSALEHVSGCLTKVEAHLEGKHPPHARPSIVRSSLMILVTGLVARRGHLRAPAHTRVAGLRSSSSAAAQRVAVARARRMAREQGRAGGAAGLRLC